MIVVTLKEFISLNFQVDVAQNVSEGANLFTLASVISKAKQINRISFRKTLHPPQGQKGDS